MRPYELPPLPQGSTQQQLDALRAYLIRLIQQLNEEKMK
nr:MAG TPA: hypothetical protein [Caudoviricetes sp.]